MAEGLSVRSQIAALLRLKLTLSWNALGSSVWGVLGMVLLLVFGGMAVIGLNVYMFSVGGTGTLQEASAAAVLAGSAVTLLWLVVPVFSSDRLMDPKQFVSFAVPRRVLVLGLTLAGMLSIGMVLTLGWMAAHVLAWRSSAAAVSVALLTLPLIVVMLGLLHQATASAAAAWLSGRRSRDVLSVLGLCAMVGMYPITQGVLVAAQTAAEAAAAISVWLAWTPLGAVYAVPADAASGEWGALSGRLGIVAAACGAALVVTRAALISITERPRGSGRTAKDARQGRVGLLGRFPATPVGAVAARQLTYWIKDPRYSAGLAMIPMMAALAVFMSLQTDSSWMLYALGPFIAWMLAFSASADIAYDHTAFSLHVTSGVSGWADRTGRVLAVLCFGVPVSLLAAALPVALIGTAEQAIVLSAVSVGCLLTMLGLSAVFSARMLYPVPKPGDSPTQTPQGSMGRSMLVMAITSALTAVLLLPEFVLLAVWNLADSAVWAWALGLVAVVKGAGTMIAGISIGAKVYDDELADIYQKVAAQ
ncbi:hypothetical protein [Nesterenkonia populi]